MKKEFLLESMERNGTTIIPAAYKEAETDIVLKTGSLESFELFCKNTNSNIVFYDERFINPDEYLFNMSEVEKIAKRHMYNLLCNTFDKLNKSVMDVTDEKMKDIVKYYREILERTELKLDKVNKLNVPDKMILYTVYHKVKVCVVFDNMQMAGFTKKDSLMEGITGYVDDMVDDYLYEISKQSKDVGIRLKLLVEDIYNHNNRNIVQAIIGSRKYLQKATDNENYVSGTSFTYDEVMEYLDFYKVMGPEAFDKYVCRKNLSLSDLREKIG